MTPPDCLYKYRGVDAYSLSSIANQAVWLAKPSTFNDPFDCATTLDQALYKESVMHAITVGLNANGDKKKKGQELLKVWPEDKDAFENFRKGIKETLQNMGVCSFSESPHTLLLWSHYADNHKGFCIGYDCSEKSNLRNLVQKVRYTDSVPRISAADFAPANSNETFDKLWLTKAKCWEYEQEWRILHKDGNKELQAPSPIKSIIFGAKMPNNYRVTIMNILKHEQHVVYKEAALVEGEFRLELREMA